MRISWEGIKTEYKKQEEIFKNEHKKIMINMAISFLLIMFATYMILIVTQTDLEGLFNNVLTMLESKGIETGNNNRLFIQLFKNNIIAVVAMMLTGLVPVIILPVVSLGFNSLIIGIVLAFSKQQTGKVMGMILVGILPHGITEILAMIISATLGVQISIKMVRLIRKQIDKEKLMQDIKGYIKTFMLVVLPLVVISAVIESYVTLELVEMFINKTI